MESIQHKPEDSKKVALKAGNKCSICTCGHSMTLPLCDNSHRMINEKNKASYKSLKIWPEEDIVLELFSKNWKK